ncbi:MAG: hypothetical protein IID45_03395 [Planctomycetes bacterium]|nr:hypothetical protein [Planctomycetota bacterium]
MRPRLRLFTGDEQGPAVATPQVSVRFEEVLVALTDALRSDRTWLTDFEDDEIQVSADLYEVISACNHLRPSA